MRPMGTVTDPQEPTYQQPPAGARRRSSPRSRSPPSSARPPQRLFDAHLVGSRAIFDGTDAPEKLTITQSGDLLMHDQASPAFAGPFDFDSTQPGIQVFQVPAGQLGVVEAHGGGGNDIITMLGAPASARLSGDAGDDGSSAPTRRTSCAAATATTRWPAALGADFVQGDAGADTMRWRLGDGSDQITGGDGDDGAVLSGGAAADQFVLTDGGSAVNVSTAGGAPGSARSGSGWTPAAATTASTPRRSVRGRARAGRRLGR